MCGWCRARGGVAVGCRGAPGPAPRPAPRLRPVVSCHRGQHPGQHPGCPRSFRGTGASTPAAPGRFVPPGPAPRLRPVIPGYWGQWPALSVSLGHLTRSLPSAIRGTGASTPHRFRGTGARGLCFAIGDPGHRGTRPGTGSGAAGHPPRNGPAASRAAAASRARRRRRLRQPEGQPALVASRVLPIVSLASMAACASAALARSRTWPMTGRNWPLAAAASAAEVYSRIS